MTKFIKPFIASLLMLMATFSFGRRTSDNFAPPVFWNVFDVTVKKNIVLLKWEVTEYNNKVFCIEHSMNGSDWETIDSVNTKNSALTLDDYYYSHINNLEGRHYYRLKQIDIDETNTGYSKVLSVMLRIEKQKIEVPAFSFLPNPATDHISIVNNSRSDLFYTGVTLLDLSGKIIAEKILQKHTSTISISELQPGIYIARVQCSDGTTFTHKIIKQ